MIFDCGDLKILWLNGSIIKIVRLTLSFIFAFVIVSFNQLISQLSFPYNFWWKKWMIFAHYNDNYHLETLLIKWPFHMIVLQCLNSWLLASTHVVKMTLCSLKNYVHVYMEICGRAKFASCYLLYVKQSVCA